jgi:hypothetical protein
MEKAGRLHQCSNKGETAMPTAKKAAKPVKGPTASTTKSKPTAAKAATGKKK